MLLRVGLFVVVVFGRMQVGFNDTSNAFAYAVLLSASLLFMMEGIMLMVSGY